MRPSGKHISVDTAMKYVYEVQGWASRLPFGGGRVGGGIDLARLRGMVRSMRRELGDAVKRPRYGVRTQHLAAAMEGKLSGGTAEEANWRAALAVGFCGLLRGGELGISDGDAWRAELHLTRADVTFFRDEEGVLHATLMMRPLKKSPGMRKTVPVVLRSGGSLLDPVEELWQLFQRDVVPQEAWAETPLFRDPRTLLAFRVSHVRSVVQWLMQAVGEDPKRFGAHSLRIGGATAALAAGVLPASIRLLGRWASDVAEVYMRISRQASSRLSALVGSTRFDDLERQTFRTEELEVLPTEWQSISLEPDLLREMDESDGVFEDML